MDKSLYIICISTYLLIIITSQLVVSQPVLSNESSTDLDDNEIDSISSNSNLLRDAGTFYRKSELIYLNIKYLVRLSKRRLQFEPLDSSLKDSVLDYFEAFSKDIELLRLRAKSDQTMENPDPYEAYQSAEKYHREITSRAKILSKYLSRHFKSFSSSSNRH